MKHEMTTYHGTNKTQAESILNNNFKMPNKAWPGDLGYGIYTFADVDENDFVKAECAAYRYAKKYRTSPVAVMKIDLCFDDSDIIDLDDPTFNSVITSNMRVVEKIVSEEIKKLERKNSGKKAVKRKNTDGIFINKILEIKNLNPKLIIRNRWEDVLYDFKQQGGQIPNSTVVVIRNTSVILNKELLV